jgi:hypothetical protein
MNGGLAGDLPEKVAEARAEHGDPAQVLTLGTVG